MLLNPIEIIESERVIIILFIKNPPKWWGILSCIFEF